MPAILDTAYGFAPTYPGDIHVNISGAYGLDQTWVNALTIIIIISLIALGLICFMVGSFVLSVSTSMMIMQQQLEGERRLEEQVDEPWEANGQRNNSQGKKGWYKGCSSGNWCRVAGQIMYM
ncbi:hypothetical protein PG996_004963 [Apiospora saccharicola]|uniref:Uncharacterized protein n=1 Tax=Apiospora saccharicola TaxID=335842 RepID=A0ABR1VN45_9PEZI